MRDPSSEPAAAGSRAPRNKEFPLFVFIATFSLVTTVLHFLIVRRLTPHVVLEELHYIPLFLGAVFLGPKGRILTYVLVSVFYIPFFLWPHSTAPLELTDRLLHLLFTGLFVFLAGIIVDREKLRQRQLEKDRYLAGIGQAATAIVHDLKNPLIVILAFSRRIKEGKSSVDIALQPIIDSAENMKKIVDSTLDFARPFQLEFRKEDIRDVVERASRSCRAKAEEREVNLSIDIPAEPIYLEIDAPNLERALINIIHNSVDASSNEQNVIISTARKKDHVEARIKDVGSGMDKETLENIFVPFFSNKKAGTGLGMPIVK